MIAGGPTEIDAAKKVWSTVASVCEYVRSIDYYHYRPFKWVLKDLSSPASAGKKGRAFSEIERRDFENDLSASQTAAWYVQMLSDVAASGQCDDEFFELDLLEGVGALSDAQHAAWLNQVLNDLPEKDAARAAMEHMFRRGKLSAADKHLAFDRILGAKTSKPVIALWWLLSDAFVRGELTSQQESDFLPGLASICAIPSQVERAGEPVPVHLWCFASQWAPEGSRLSVTFMDASVDGKPAEVSSTNMLHWFIGYIPPQAPGLHRLSIRLNESLEYTAIPSKVRLSRSVVRDVVASFDVARKPNELH